MNYSLNPPRPGDKNYSDRMDAAACAGSMADVLAMMKKQGINLDGFEAEAEDIWKGLDNMSASDPDEYRKFIQNQYQESGQETPSSKNSTNSGSLHTPVAKSAREDRYFRPNVGFSIKTRTSGGDGLHIRGDGDGKDFYINFCHHPAIEAPLDRHGMAVDMKDFYRQRLPDGLQVRRKSSNSSPYIFIVGIFLSQCTCLCTLLIYAL